ncbi:MAG: putative quinol monooxygenase [Actinocatenispora sp.]
MSELQVIARYTVSPGNQDRVLDLLSTLTVASRAEPGTVSFTVNRQVDDEHSVVLLERYASRDAFAAHRESAHFTELVLGQIVPLLDSRVVETFDVV